MFRKQSRPSADFRPRFEQDPSLAEALARRVEAIAFQPTKGFLKDSQQPKRSASKSRVIAANAPAPGSSSESAA